MTDCCVHEDGKRLFPSKHQCPVNLQEYPQVSSKTISYHIQNPWKWKNNAQGYYFCDDPECDVVYFGEDNSVMLTADLRTKVGIKDQSNEAILCYCYGVSKSLAKQGTLKQFVVNQTKNKLCACDVMNPSGRCCLKYFPGG